MFTFLVLVLLSAITLGVYVDNPAIVSGAALLAILIGLTIWGFEELCAADDIKLDRTYWLKHRLRREA
jgi:hypothetical protein